MSDAFADILDVFQVGYTLGENSIARDKYDVHLVK